MSVILYTQPDCLPCKRVEKKLTEAGVEFELVDLTKDRVAADYVKRVLVARSTPVIEVDGWQPIIGYQPDKVKEVIDAFGV
jgi:glutaredoxin-like protein NrdH